MDINSSLLGVSIGQWPIWQSRPLRAAIVAVVVLGPTAVLVATYMGKMETPRFVAPAMPLLALGTALLIEALIAASTRVRVMAPTVLVVAGLASWAARRPRACLGRVSLSLGDVPDAQ